MNRHCTHCLGLEAVQQQCLLPAVQGCWRHMFVWLGMATAMCRPALPDSWLHGHGRRELPAFCHSTGLPFAEQQCGKGEAAQWVQGWQLGAVRGPRCTLSVQRGAAAPISPWLRASLVNITQNKSEGRESNTHLYLEPVFCHIDVTKSSKSNPFTV